MSEYIGSDSDSDDSVESSSSTTERAAPARDVGEILLGRDKAEAASVQPETIFARHDAAAEKAAAAAHFSLMAELAGESDDDDDDDETENADGQTNEPETVDTSLANEVVAESEAPDDHLSESEIKTVIEAYDADRTTELATERASVEADSVEAATVAANELFIDKVDEKLADPDTNVETALDEAAAETEQAIDDAEAASTDSTAESTNSVAPETTSESDPSDDEEDDDTTSATSNGSSTSSTSASGGSSSGSSGSGSSSGGSGGSGSGGGGSGTPPPFGSTPLPTPTPPFGSGGGSSSYAFGPPAPAPGYNTVRTGPVITPEDLAAARRHGETSGLVIGGILGYLIGRRRGRIKTEKRLLPIQDKLETQVDSLHQTVANKEQDIRKLASEKFRLTEDAQRRSAIERLRPEPKPPKPLPFNRLVETSPGAAITELGNETQPAIADFIPAAELLTGADSNNSESSEIYRSATTGHTVEIFKREPAPLPERHIEHVERLSTKEILELSERVVIGGARLRDIYEGKQITEPGLKHILTEFLSGGDVKRALDEELLVKQMGYERDPKVRRNLSAGYGAQAGAQSGSTAGGGSSAAAQQSANGQVGPGAAGRQSEQSDIPNEAQARAKRTERAIVSGWVTIVTILVIIVFWLILRRG